MSKSQGPHVLHRLNATKLKNAKPGFHTDGGGLYLRVKPNGSKSWVLRVQHLGKREDIGLGGFDYVDLKTAREKALKLRIVAKDGENARAVRDAKRVRIPTFAEAMMDAHKSLSEGMAAKNAAAFLTSLNEYVIPKIGNLRVDRIGTGEIGRVLAQPCPKEPLWCEKPALAKKLDTRIRKVLGFANFREWRAAPAPTRSQLKPWLPAQRDVKHFEAMDYKGVPAFFAAQMAKRHTPGRLALLFTIATAARSKEVRFATWEQIDEHARTWSRPAELMKNGDAHRVPLSDAALAVLAIAKGRFGNKGLVFPGTKGQPLSDMTLSKVMRDAKLPFVPHGFRSSFRNWSAEKTDYQHDVLEMCLAHRIGNKSELSYKRTDYLEKRRPVMADWGAFIASALSATPIQEALLAA